MFSLAYCVHPRSLHVAQDEDADPAMSALVTDPKQQKLKSKLLIPDKGAVYDFRWERSGTRWEHWMDTIPTYKVPDGASFQVLLQVKNS